jgi:hypothetical protein
VLGAGGGNFTNKGSIYQLKDSLHRNLPVIEGIIRVDVQSFTQGANPTYYCPILTNITSDSITISAQTFATQVNENRTDLNLAIPPGRSYAVDNNAVVFWAQNSAEVETTNLWFRKSGSLRWYEIKWWCFANTNSGTETKKYINISIQRKQ